MSALKVSLGRDSFGTVYLQAIFGTVQTVVGCFLGSEGRLVLSYRPIGWWPARMGIAEDPAHLGYVRVYNDAQDPGGLFDRTWPSYPWTIWQDAPAFPTLKWFPSGQGNSALLAFNDRPGRSPICLLEFNQHGILLTDHVVEFESSTERMSRCFQLNGGMISVGYMP